MRNINLRPIDVLVVGGRLELVGGAKLRVAGGCQIAIVFVVVAVRKLYRTLRQPAARLRQVAVCARDSPRIQRQFLAENFSHTCL